jgi:hypothetical protein
MKLLQGIFLLLGTMLFIESYALLPKDCKSIKIQHATNMEFDFKEPTVLYVYKKSTKNIQHNNAKFWLVDADKSSDDPLSIELLPDTWSAMFLPPVKVELICLESMPGHEQQLMCDEEITACQHKPTKKWDGVTDKNKSQWIVRNQANSDNQPSEAR